MRMSVTDKLNRGTRYSVSLSLLLPLSRIKVFAFGLRDNRFRVHPSFKIQFRKIRVDLLERAT